MRSRDNYVDKRRKRWTANSRTFKGLLDGRIQNTAVEKGMWLSADGGCLICGEKTNQMSTATLIGKSGLMIGFQLCQQHESEAQNHSTLLEYVSEKMGGRGHSWQTPKWSGMTIKRSRCPARLSVASWSARSKKSKATRLQRSGNRGSA